jgi:hypothetical protein
MVNGVRSASEERDFSCSDPHDPSHSLPSQYRAVPAAMHYPPSNGIHCTASTKNQICPPKEASSVLFAMAMLPKNMETAVTLHGDNRGDKDLLR